MERIPRTPDEVPTQVQREHPNITRPGQHQGYPSEQNWDNWKKSGGNEGWNRWNDWKEQLQWKDSAASTKGKDQGYGNYQKGKDQSYGKQGKGKSKSNY